MTDISLHAFHVRQQAQKSQKPFHSPAAMYHAFRSFSKMASTLSLLLLMPTSRYLASQVGKTSNPYCLPMRRARPSVTTRMPDTREISVGISRFHDTPACFQQAVAEMVGYHDATYFSSMFKKLVGVSPSEYRNPEGWDD